MTGHLESKLLSFPGGRFDTTDEGERARCGVCAVNCRAAGAAALREWATAALAGEEAERPVVVCGDLNDTRDAATTQLLVGPPGSEFGTGGVDRPDRGDRQRLWATGSWTSPPDDWSRFNHILVSHALSDRLREARTVPLDVPGVGVRPQLVPRAAGEPPSDHRPVPARFDL